FGLGLGTDAPQVGADLVELAVSFDQVATVTAELFEQVLAAGDGFRVWHPEVGVAADAACLDQVAAAQRMLPELHLAVRHLGGVDRGALAAVARGAAELIGWMLGE